MLRVIMEVFVRLLNGFTAAIVSMQVTMDQCVKQVQNTTIFEVFDNALRGYSKWLLGNQQEIVFTVGWQKMATLNI